MTHTTPKHGGGWPPSGMDPEVIRVLRPSDGSLVGELAVTPSHEVPRRVERARSVQAGWASLLPKDRERRLRALLEAIDERTPEIEDTIVAETGKPRAEATVEIVSVVDHIRFLLKNATGFFRPRRIPTGWMAWKQAFVQRDPLGVVGVISPWNYPFMLSMTPTCTALFGGNGVVLKPSEFTPYSGLLVEDIARDAGLPEGLVQVVIGGGETGEALVRAGVDKIFFTGGSRTGRAVLAAAADSLTPSVLELGGKDAAIVLEDADLARASRGIVWGAFLNAGQSCIAVERVYVVERVYDAFLREVLAHIRKLKAGSSAGVEIGPMTTPAQLAWVEQQLAEAVEAGATVVTGGHRTDPASNVLEPTVLTGLDPTSSILREESFGPVLPVVRVKDCEEAIHLANETPYGLSASVWTKDRKRGLALARRIRAGAVCVNDALAHFGIAGLPFGGVGESGFGRSHGIEGLEEVTRSRSLLVDRMGIEREPWWFPYNRGTERLLRGALLFRLRGGLKGAFAAIALMVKGGRR
ncbi:MAG: aldehyde dehydrogenase family protein [Gemmatimonadetes bacterium]|nr:aldehyde dehydrogenase family protein [Gemmatimonadota bacterium]NNM06775.1 aldehyde dehydrogenase family protein [Gemmatimonadota bacterium]